MAYITLSFDTREEREAAYTELREKYYDVVKYSNPCWIEGAWKSQWFVGYLTPVIETEEQLAEEIKDARPQIA
jgi:hypothetical protein